MIALLPFDIAYGYDALAILEVKRSKGSNTSVQESFERFHNILRGQVGESKHALILCSPEYRRLVEVNERLFDAFDWLHTAGVTAPAEEVKRQAIETDRINGVDRPATKRALQEKWFGASLTEVKLGYTETKS